MKFASVSVCLCSRPTLATFPSLNPTDKTSAAHPSPGVYTHAHSHTQQKNNQVCQVWRMCWDNLSAHLSYLVFQGGDQPSAPVPRWWWWRTWWFRQGGCFSFQPACFSESWIKRHQQCLCESSAQPHPEPAAPTVCLALTMRFANKMFSIQSGHKAQGLI